MTKIPTHIQFLEDCDYLRSRIGEIVWSSEEIVRITTTFLQKKVEGIHCIFPKMTQKFLYTFWLILSHTNDRTNVWNNMLEIDLIEEIKQQHNIWLQTRTEFSEVNKNVAVELILQDSQFQYTYSTFYSIIGTKEFNQIVREIGVQFRFEDTGTVNIPLRKRGYTDKGSLRPTHLSTIWNDKFTLDEILRKKKENLDIERTTSQIFNGLLL